MQQMLTRRTVIQVGLEATYGTDPASLASVLAWDVEPDVRGEVLMRPILRDTLSPIPHVVGMKDIAVNFKTELKAGDPGTVPEMNLLLAGCGYSSAAHTGTGLIAYAPTAAGTEASSVSLYLFMDGNKHKVTGARGTCRAVMEAGQYGIMEWEFQGLYNAVQTETIPDLTGVSIEKPPIVYASNFNIGGFSPVCSRCQIDVGNTVTKVTDLNATAGVDSFRISGREPKMEFDADAVVESSNPFWGDWAGNVVDTYGIVVGSSVGLGQGHSVKFSGTFQYETNKYADSDGIRKYECVASLCSSTVNSQDDELTITFGSDATA